MRFALAVVALSSCATPYAFRFDSQPFGDDDVSLQSVLDATQARCVTLTVTNHTREPVQVAWTKITVTGPNGLALQLRPDSDLGWVAAGEKLTAELSPFTLPASGDEALALDNRPFELSVPMTVHDEPRVLHSTFIAHAQPL